MSTHLGKIALMVVMTHGFRALGRMSSPRWAGLALGLPCSTAIALVGCGVDRGVDDAVAMSGTSLIGLAGAVALPVAYARGVVRGWTLSRAILLGVAAYLAIAVLAGRLLPTRGHAGLGLASVAVASAIGLASRTPREAGPGRAGGARTSKARIRALRTAVPVACFLAAIAMGEALGPEMAGLVSTFPGVTLTFLILTHMEAGPSSAIQVARALPSGNLGMVAFLGAFRLGCPALGLFWGTVVAYASALTMLALVVTSDGIRAYFRSRVFERLVATAVCLNGPDLGPEVIRFCPPEWSRVGLRAFPLAVPLAA